MEVLYELLKKHNNLRYQILLPDYVFDELCRKIFNQVNSSTTIETPSGNWMITRETPRHFITLMVSPEIKEFVDMVADKQYHHETREEIYRINREYYKLIVNE